MSQYSRCYSCNIKRNCELYQRIEELREIYDTEIIIPDCEDWE